MLQRHDLNISQATFLVEGLIKEIEQHRSDEKFNSYWRNAEQIAERIGVEYVEKRRKIVSSHLGDNGSSSTNFSGKGHYRVSFFYCILDLMLSALKNRFTSNTLSLLKSSDCLVSPNVEKVDMLRELASFYPRDLRNIEALLAEYSVFTRCLLGLSTVPTRIHEIYLHIW